MQIVHNDTISWQCRLKRCLYWVLEKDYRVYLCLVIATLPLIAASFGHTNYSDDYQYIDMWSMYFKLAPVQALLSPHGAYKLGDHITPVFWAYNALVVSISTNPTFVHLVTVFFFFLTALVIFQLVHEYFQDRLLGFLSGILFLLNYHTPFKSLFFNNLHCHTINTFTGVVSLFFLIRFMRLKRVLYLLASFIFLVLTVLNWESGFLFLPAFMCFLLFNRLNRKISRRTLVIAIATYLIVVPVFLGISYLEKGNFFPMSYRFKKGERVGDGLYKIDGELQYRFQGTRALGEVAYNSIELLTRSLGLAQPYHKIVYPPLKSNLNVKEALIRAARYGEIDALKALDTLQVLQLVLIVGASFVLVLLFIVAMLRSSRRETSPFMAGYLAIFLSLIIIFARIDFANSIAVFSSVLLADFMLSFFRYRTKTSFFLGVGLLAFYLALALWTWADEFDDCYKTAFYGISKEVIQGPAHIYDEINEQAGHYFGHGVILYMHDHTAFHRTTKRERIGDMIGIPDLLCSNAKRYENEFLNSSQGRELANRPTFVGMESPRNDNNGSIITTGIVKVSSFEEALKKSQDVNMPGVDQFYISWDYDVRKL